MRKQTKTILVSACLFVCLLVNGQSSYKSKIIGSWLPYKIVADVCYTKDSASVLADILLKEIQKKHPEHVLDALDTIGTKREAEDMIWTMLYSYWEFKKNGKCTIQYGVYNNGWEGPPVVNGTYNFVDTNSFVVKDIYGPTLYQIRSVNENELVVDTKDLRDTEGKKQTVPIFLKRGKLDPEGHR